MTWLLTGGAGYIGSHIVLAFQEAGTDVVVLDDLSTGYRDFVPDGVPFVEGSVTDPDAVAYAIGGHAVTGVMHLAGLKYAGVSVREPLRFYRQNVTGMQVLLEAVEQRGIDRFVFSSSASWYGTPTSELVTEDAPASPESPYGQTKVASEWLLRDLAVVRPSLRQTSLRYFNVVGSGPVHLTDRSPHNLFPRVFGALTRGERPVVNGIDYPTPDGSCVRDYVHVSDVAEAHVIAARRLDKGEPCADGLQHRTRRGVERAGGAGRDAARHRHRSRAAGGAAPAGRPGAHRRGGRPHRRGLRLAGQPGLGRHGGQRLGRLAAAALMPTAFWVRGVWPWAAPRRSARRSPRSARAPRRPSASPCRW